MIAPIPFSVENGTPEYFICQYMPDVLRKEPRNVGVIVRWNEFAEARFIGESGDEDIDGRGLSWIRDLGAYKEWVKHWKKIAAGDPSVMEERLLRSGKSHYFVVEGGFVSATDTSITNLCSFLFSTIVSRGGIDAFNTEIDEPVPPRAQLKRIVSKVFRKEGILGAGARVRFPVMEDQDVIGSTKPHRFTFAQTTDSLIRPIELIDIEHGSVDQIRFHAGWTKTAFDDVFHRHKEQRFDPIAIVVPATSSSRLELNDYCFGIVESSSARVIDWTNEKDKFELVNDCKRDSGLLIE
jgi:hypothetical protein